MTIRCIEYKYYILCISDFTVKYERWIHCIVVQAEIRPKSNGCHLSRHDICHTPAPDCCNRIKELQLLCLQEQMYFMDTP